MRKKYFQWGYYFEEKIRIDTELHFMIVNSRICVYEIIKKSVLNFCVYLKEVGSFYKSGILEKDQD